MRDNALAAELIRLGHEVTLLPFYTPTLTDEDNVSRQEQVFFGGISVYLEQHIPLFRKTPRFVDKLIDAPNVIKAFTSGSISVDATELGALSTTQIGWDQPHEGNLFEHLYARRAIQRLA